MMALVSELNEVVADTLTFPLPTIAVFARRLRDAGLISKKGRGRGAAHATPLDGARLLIALLANSSAVLAPECVRDFGGLINDHSAILHERIKNADGTTTDVPLRDITLEKACGLQRGHTFEEALAAIIAGFATGGFSRHLHHVIVHDTALAAKINLAGNIYTYTHKILVDVPPGGNHIEAADRFLEFVAKYKRGIDSRRMLGTSELRKIALVINGHEAAFPS